MRNAVHNAARLLAQKHPLARKIAGDYAAGKSLTKYRKAENDEVFNRAGTTTVAVIEHIKAVITVEVKEQSKDE